MYIYIFQPIWKEFTLIECSSKSEEFIEYILSENCQ